jgi:hypothetical protein
MEIWQVITASVLGNAAVLSVLGLLAKSLLEFDLADLSDPDLVYANYLKTCAMLGIEPTPREQALVGRALSSTATET